MSQPTSGRNPFSPPEADVSTYGSEAPNAIRLQYTLRRRDLLAWNAVHQFKMPLLQTICVLVALVVASEFPTTRWLSVFATIYALLWVAQSVFILASVFAARNRRLLAPHTVELRSDGLLVESEFARMLHFWKGVQKVAAGPGHVSVYINANAAHIIPNRAFSSEAQRHQFLSIVGARSAAAT